MMYVLVKISGNDDYGPEAVSSKKKLIVAHLKKNNYYWSPKLKRYINDKTAGKGGSGTDYTIDKIRVIK